jgi:NAD dependent epimerase/dehydratase
MSRLDGRRVLVTGAGGFIGSHLVEALIAEGANVRALVHYNARGDWGNLEDLPADVLSAADVLAGEIQDPFSVARAIADREMVFHLAALIGIPYSYLAPKSYVDTNVLGTLNVLEASLKADVERVVHTSTSETYGTAQYTPIDEYHPLQAHSPYSASKIGADKIAESYFRSTGLPITTLRPFNTFGPRQSLRAVIPAVIGQALGAEEIRMGSLEPVRDFTYVVDTARAFIAVALSPSAVGATLNAGTGTGIAIGDLAQLIIRLTDSPAKIVHDQQRVRPEMSEVLELVCDSGRVRELTGWRPIYELQEGLERTIAWMRDRKVVRSAHHYEV